MTRVLHCRLTLLCLVGCLSLTLAARNMLQRRMRFVSSKVEFSPKYYYNLTSNVVNGTLSVDMYIPRTLPLGLRCNQDVQMKLANSRHFQTLFSYDFSVCQMLHEVFKESLVRTWFRNTLKYANFMQNCPVYPGYYYIHNMTLEAGSIPVYLQAGDYRFDSYVYYGKRKTKREEMAVRIITDFKIL